MNLGRELQGQTNVHRYTRFLDLGFKIVFDESVIRICISEVVMFLERIKEALTSGKERVEKELNALTPSQALTVGSVVGFVTAFGVYKYAQNLSKSPKKPYGKLNC